MAEIYEGVKFKHIRTGQIVAPVKPLHELMIWAKIFDDYNFAPAYEGGSSGNLSCRISPKSDKFLITASHTALREHMQLSDFCYIFNCNLARKTVMYSGMRAPSSETILHDAIYKARPEVNAVFHGHSLEILEYAQHAGIPTTKTETAYGTPELVFSLLDILENHNFVILKNHGFVALADTAEAAGKLTLEHYFAGH